MGDFWVCKDDVFVWAPNNLTIKEAYDLVKWVEAMNDIVFKIK